MKRTDARKLNPQAREAIRLRVIDFLRTGKGTQEEAAAIFQLSNSAVKKICKHYKAGGRQALKAKKRGPQQPIAQLREQQIKQVKVLS